MLHSFSPRRLLQQSAAARLLVAFVILVPLWLAIQWAVLLS
ncbi:hypothetical protein GGQ73_000951 [Rhizobium skierniewicense]|uniref:Uncharacterized protein n=1 Tax=Rhizobium skierniewicense TaxID=984260 RepID=A0A7W6C575_9HYPH|nr:hypothetical protein [Rhizobium skierniewicense]MBB3945026.1 hypothetical protein [Rhizobium skierniewicense]